jgi:hypothetical protein
MRIWYDSGVSGGGSDSDLTLLDVTHAHSVDSVALDNTNSALLTVTDVTHAHSVDSITLTTASALAIADALHAHVADSVALSTVTQSSLTVADALHAHVVGSVALSIPGAGVTLSPEDIAAIAEAVWSHSSATDIAIKLAEAWGRLGLDPSKPLISGQTEISFGAIVMALAGNETSSTLTRQ